MLTRLFLYLLIGVVPVAAQASMDGANKLNHDQAPAVAPVNPPANEVIQPGVNAPPPGTPIPQHLRPAEIVKPVRVKEFSIAPGTIRQGLTDKASIRTTIKLTAPTPKALICHIETSDPMKMTCDDIIVPQGQMKTDGYVNINWKHVLHDCEITIKAYDAEHPETLFSGRVHLVRKKGDDEAAPALH